MRMLRKAAVVVAVLGSVGLLGAGNAYAGGGKDSYIGGEKESYADGGEEGYAQGKKKSRKGRTHVDITQGTSCRTHDMNFAVLGQIGILNGALGNAFNGEGVAGVQKTKVGSSLGCNNVVGK